MPELRLEKARRGYDGYVYQPPRVLTPGAAVRLFDSNLRRPVVRAALERELAESVGARCARDLLYGCSRCADGCHGRTAVPRRG